ncbi:MAG: phosphoribosylglycinamide formyltransferase [Bowdeniella nasicola]|nr:phosphoribosylglycinamide formyltransferase [Bowdeniella nasicola]
MNESSPTTHVTPPLSSEDRPARLTVLASGGGSNLAALLAACEEQTYGARVVAVGTDRHGTGAADLACQAGIRHFTCRVADYADRAAWDEALTAEVAREAPDLVISAGFLKLCGPAFLRAFAGRYVNTHNSLLPAFPGIRGPADALAYGVKLAGATLFVVDEGIDTGVVLAQVAVPVHFEDDADTLLERIKVAERRQLVDTIGQMCREGWTIRGRLAKIGA